MVPYATLQNLTMLLEGPGPKNSGWECRMRHHFTKHLTPPRVVGGSDLRHQYPYQKPLRWLAVKAPAREG